MANQVDSLRTFNASFRIAGRTPELWNAVTGTITRPAQWKEADGRTEVLFRGAGTGKRAILSRVALIHFWA